LKACRTTAQRALRPPDPSTRRDSLVPTDRPRGDRSIKEIAMLRSLTLAIVLAIAGPAFAWFEPQQPIQIRPNPFGGGYNVQQFGHPTRRFVPPPLAAGTRFSSSATRRSRAAQTLSAAE